MSLTLVALVQALCAQADSPAHPPMTVALDLSALSERGFSNVDGVALERAIMVRLVQEGFAVVNGARSPAVKLKITDAARTIHIAARGPVGEASTSVRFSREGTRELHVTLAQKAVDLARVVSAPARAEAPRAEPAVADEAHRAAAVESAPPGTPPAESRVPIDATPVAEPAAASAVELWALGLLLTRAYGTDPAVGAGVRWRAWGDGGLDCAAETSWSRGEAIHVTETRVGCGPGLRLWGASRITVDAALRVGVLLHSFTVDDVTASRRSDTLTDVDGAVTATVVYHLTHVLGATAVMSWGLSGHSAAHQRSGEVLWRRGMSYLTAGAGLVAAF